MDKIDLKIDWATHEAAKYACEHWHYSKCLPIGKIVKIGVWEQKQFTGVVLFSRGATPHIGSPYNLPQTEVCELTRVALKNHLTPVSKIVGISIKFLKRSNLGLRLIVSYSDMDQKHYGTIYQAGNWIYTGLFNEGTRGAFIVKGKKIHPRSIGAAGGVQSLKWIKEHLDQNAKELLQKGNTNTSCPLTTKCESG